MQLFSKIKNDLKNKVIDTIEKPLESKTGDGFIGKISKYVVDDLENKRVDNSELDEMERLKTIKKYHKKNKIDMNESSLKKISEKE